MCMYVYVYIGVYDLIGVSGHFMWSSDEYFSVSRTCDVKLFVHLCMYACMHVCIYIYIYIFIYVPTNISQ